MSKPNINIPAEFAVNGVKTPFSNAKVQNGFDRINPDVLPGDNLNKFIDDTYKGLNGVLELYKGAVLYDVTETYSNTSIVFYIDPNDNNKIKIYHSLQNSNTGNSLSDDTYWEEVQLGGDLDSKVDKDQCVDLAPIVPEYIIPDYTAGVAKTVDTTYTADKAGLVTVYQAGGSGGMNVSISVNGVYPSYIWINTSNFTREAIVSAFVGKGDTYIGHYATPNSGASVTFYPLKGVNQ